MTENVPSHQSPGALPPYHVADLLDILDVRETGLVRRSAVADPPDPELAAPETIARVFSGPSQKQRYERTFGGQLLAQAIVAAARTVTADPAGSSRPINSMHTTFLAGGDDTRDIRYAVESLADGRSFSTRRIEVRQGGRLLAVSIASFQQASDAGPEASAMEHQEPMPPAPDPGSLRDVAGALAGVPEPYAPVCIVHGPIELRHTQGNLYAAPDPTPAATQTVWLRSRRQLPEDPTIHAAFLAYASDYSILEPVLRRHGTSWADPRLRQASLDHSIWFHRPGRADQWVLHAGHSPSACGGRGLGLGRMYAADGTLLASIAQEGMLRLKQ